MEPLARSADPETVVDKLLELYRQAGNQSITAICLPHRAYLYPIRVCGSWSLESGVHHLEEPS